MYIYTQINIYVCVFIYINIYISPRTSRVSTTKAATHGVAAWRAAIVLPPMRIAGRSLKDLLRFQGFRVWGLGA